MFTHPHTFYSAPETVFRQYGSVKGFGKFAVHLSNRHTDGFVARQQPVRIDRRLPEKGVNGSFQTGVHPGSVFVKKAIASFSRFCTAYTYGWAVTSREKWHR